MKHAYLNAGRDKHGKKRSKNVQNICEIQNFTVLESEQTFPQSP